MYLLYSVGNPSYPLSTQNHCDPAPTARLEYWTWQQIDVYLCRFRLNPLM